MIIGGRRSREAESQAGRLRDRYPRPSPHMSILARIIINSRTFQRLIDRLDTREGVRQESSRSSGQPAPSRPSDPVMPEKGPFRPRMHPLGSMVFRSRFVQRLLGNPPDKSTAPISTWDSNEDRSSGHAHGSPESDPSGAQGRQLTDAEIRELRQRR